MRKLFSLALLVLAACASGKPYDAANISKAAKDTAQLIVYRPNALVGMIETHNFKINDAYVCDLSSGSYFVTNIQPGKAKLVASQYGGRVNSGLTARFEGGKRYYVRVTPDTGKAVLGGIGMGFGALGGAVSGAINEPVTVNDGVYQVRLIDPNVAEEEVIATKQSTCSP